MYTILKITYAFASTAPRTATFTLCVLQRRPYLWLLPTRARAPTLYVMGGRQRLLGDAYIPKRAQELSSLRHGVWDS